MTEDEYNLSILDESSYAIIKRVQEEGVGRTRKRWTPERLEKRCEELEKELKVSSRDELDERFDLWDFSGPDEVREAKELNRIYFILESEGQS